MKIADQPLRVLVGCERSGVVRRAFRALGHDAWSCDLAPADDGSEYHFQMDLRDLLALYEDGLYGFWDLLIVHPECRFLCNSGVLRLYKGGKKRNGRDWPRWQQMEEAARFFKQCLEVKIPRICVENPVMHGYAKYRIGNVAFTQSIQPYEFGDDASKCTCLWLIGLEELKPTRRVQGRIVEWNGRRVERWANQTDSGQNRLGPSEMRSALRAETYPGIAAAMASQWGGQVL